MQDSRSFLQDSFIMKQNDLQSFHPINLNLQIFRFPLRARDLFAKIVTTFERNLQNNVLIPFCIYEIMIWRIGGP